MASSPQENLMLLSGIWCLIIAVLFLWCNFRVNDNDVYKLSFAGWLVLGMDFIFMINIPVLNMILFFASTTAIFVTAVIFTTVVLVRHLPFFGVREDFLTDAKTGVLHDKAMLLMTIIALLPTIYIFWSNKDSVNMFYSFGLWQLLITMLIFSIVGFFAGRALLPWTELRKYPLPDGGYLQEITNIFVCNGPATGVEIFTAGVTAAVIFSSSVWLIKESFSGTDMLALIALGLFCMIMARSQVNKMKYEEPVEVERLVNKKKSSWN